MVACTYLHHAPRSLQAATDPWENHTALHIFFPRPRPRFPNLNLDLGTWLRVAKGGRLRQQNVMYTRNASTGYPPWSRSAFCFQKDVAELLHFRFPIPPILMSPRALNSTRHRESLTTYALEDSLQGVVLLVRRTGMIDGRLSWRRLMTPD